jgi:hypothetical protein
MADSMTTDERKLGPNMRRLLARVVARRAIPSGGGLADGINFIKDQNRFKQVHRESLAWIDEAINVIRSAPDNCYGDDEETIAGVIVDEVEKAINERR